MNFNSYLRSICILLALLFLSFSSAFAQNSVCAKVTISLKQQAVLTRTAFEANLGITNGASGTISGVNVKLEIKDPSGQLVNSLFDIPTPQLTGIADVAGSGSITPGATGKAKWLIVPTENAAPSTSPVVYSISGSVSHFENGVLLTIPMFPSKITVYPDAALYLRYYLQNPVYGDNPFTIEKEPAEPFSLGLIVTNSGNGVAKDLTIKAAKPEIVKNTENLIIAFQVIAAQLGVAPLSPCLTIGFGDLQPGQTAVARWLLTSTLQGQFKKYSATFQHITGLGSPGFSQIKDTKIFELNHVIQIPGQDGIPDFLVNNPPTVEQDDIPDEIHTSDLQILPVHSDAQASPTDTPNIKNLVVYTTATIATPGWNYLRIADASAGALTLGLVKRINPNGSFIVISTGATGDICNAWTTHRYYPINGPPQGVEHRIHIVDNLATAGTYQYELTYLPELHVSSVIVNGGLAQRSNLTDISVSFTCDTNIQMLINDGSVKDVIALWWRQQNGAAVQVSLTPDRYTWDPQMLVVKIDLTDDNAGPSRKTIVPEGNYELRINTKLINCLSTKGVLHDDDGVNDGVYHFGTKEDDYFYQLNGDVATQNRTVNERDSYVVSKYLGLKLGDPDYNANADANGDNIIDQKDLDFVTRFTGHTIIFY